MKKAAHRAAFSKVIQLERDPDAGPIPVTASVMFAPAIMTAVTPTPVVVMDANAKCRAVVIAFGGMPARSPAIANHISGRGRRGSDNRRRAGQSTQNNSSDFHV